MDLGENGITATLVFPVLRLSNQDIVFLGRKTKKFGAGLLNGWGGKVEEGETILNAAIRELREESGLIAKTRDLVYVGRITFYTQDRCKRIFNVLVHVFLLRKWRGQFRIGDGMKDPGWWPTNHLPIEKMMPADAHWVPSIFQGHKVIGDFLYGPEQKNVIWQEIRVVKHLGGVE